MHFSVTRDVMAAILTVRHIKLNIWLCRLRPTYLKKNPAKFHPDPIWNNGASGFFWWGRPNNKNNKTTRSDMRSVPHLKKMFLKPC